MGSSSSWGRRVEFAAVGQELARDGIVGVGGIDERGERRRREIA